jgi:hypothetical protein
MSKRDQDFFDRVYRIEVAAIRPGDTIVIYPRRGLESPHISALREQASQIWPENKIVFTTGIARIEVMHSEVISDVVGTMDEEQAS